MVTGAIARGKGPRPFSTEERIPNYDVTGTVYAIEDGIKKIKFGNAVLDILQGMYYIKEARVIEKGIR